jgi:hypothetical protein
MLVNGVEKGSRAKAEAELEWPEDQERKHSGCDKGGDRGRRERQDG